MSEGATADVTFTPYPNEVFSGVVTKVAKVANVTDGLYTAEIAISTKEMELRPGMIAEVDLKKVSDQVYSIIPFDALLDVRGIRGTVYLTNTGTASAIEHDVTINNVNGDQVSVLEDLSAYDQVITRGHHGLKNQSPVIVID